MCEDGISPEQMRGCMLQNQVWSYMGNKVTLN